MIWLLTLLVVLGYCWIIKLMVFNNAHDLSRLTKILCVLWFVLCGIGFSDAGYNTPLWMLCFYVALAWGFSWIIRLILVWCKKRELNTLKRPLLYWIIIPSALFLPMLLSHFGIFSLLRFKLSEAAFVEYATQVRTGKIDLAFEFEHPPRKIGLYRVTVTELLSDGTVRFITSSHAILDKAGFAHSPTHSPIRRGEDSYKQINQQWWYYYQSW